MKIDNWTKWLIQTAEKWSDIAPIVKSTGIDTVDSDHYQLIKYAIELNKLVRELSGDRFNMDRLNKQHLILCDIYDYAKYHFAHEEKVMEGYKIRDPLQYARHAEILQTLEEFVNAFEEGKLTASHRLKVSVTEWIIEHVNDVDWKTFSVENLQETLRDTKKWSDIESVIAKGNIPPVDVEHRGIIEALLRLAAGKGKSSGRSNLENLKAIIQKHCENEEGIITRYNLPYLEVQKNQHSMFLAALEQELEKTDDALASSLVNFKTMAINWWVNHINRMDHPTLSVLLRMENIIYNSKSMKDFSWMVSEMREENINKEHAGILKKAGELEQLARSDQPDVKEEALQVFSELIGLLRQHFSSEEEVLIRNKIERTHTHQINHSEIIARFEAFLEEYQRGVSVLSEHLLNKMLNIWLTHVNKYDVDAFGEKGNG